jgi:hypothetical protein
VLKGEAISFGKTLSWEIEPQLITIDCSDEYSARLGLIGYQAIMENEKETFDEMDFEDGLVRLRFELMRHLNPSVFESLGL